jgi:hypothetical protein
MGCNCWQAATPNQLPTEYSVTGQPAQFHSGTRRLRRFYRDLKLLLHLGLAGCITPPFVPIPAAGEFSHATELADHCLYHPHYRRRNIPRDASQRAEVKKASIRNTDF